MAHDRRQSLGQLFEVTGSFRQHERRTSLPNCRRDVIDDQAISSVVGDQRLVKIMELDAQVGVPGARRVESRRTHPDVVGKRSLCGLLARTDSMADRSALHENDWVVPVLAGHGRRQAKDIPGLRSPDQLLEARRRQVMAFVHDQMTVFPDAVIDHARADEALDQRYVERAVRLVAAAADAADGPGRQSQEGCQPFDPLLQ